MRYEYKRVRAKSSFLSKFMYDEHREIIDDMAKKGYKYVGFIPVEIIGYGVINIIDLIFEAPDDIPS